MAKIYKSIISNKKLFLDLILIALCIYTIFHLGYSIIRYFGQSDFDVMFKKAISFKETGVYPDFGRYTYHHSISY